LSLSENTKDSRALKPKTISHEEWDWRVKRLYLTHSVLLHTAKAFLGEHRDKNAAEAYLNSSRSRHQADLQHAIERAEDAAAEFEGRNEFLDLLPPGGDPDSHHLFAY
jgi:hypothetical protein